jgi:molecular chaperone DnaK
MAADFQTVVGIKVYQGERELAHDNKLLENFQLVGIPPTHRGVPRIDADSIAHASATYKATSKDQSITISPGSGVYDSEIKSAIAEALVANTQLCLVPHYLYSS